MCLYNQQGRCTYSIFRGWRLYCCAVVRLPGFLHVQGRGLGGGDVGSRSVSAPCGFQVAQPAHPYARVVGLVNENSPRFSFQQTFCTIL